MNTEQVGNVISNIGEFSENIRNEVMRSIEETTVESMKSQAICRISTW
jgi:hypothetical protein